MAIDDKRLKVRTHLLLYAHWASLKKLIIHEKNLKFRLIFIYCITWYIFNQFGGLEFNSTNYEDCSRGLAFESVIVDNTNMKNFCADAKNTTTSEGRIKFYEKYDLEGYAADEDRSLSDRFQLNFYKKFNLSQQHKANRKEDIACNYNNNWYIVFVVIAALMIVLEMIVLIQKLMGMKCRIKENGDNSEALSTVLDIPGAL